MRAKDRDIERHRAIEKTRHRDAEKNRETEKQDIERSNTENTIQRSDASLLSTFSSFADSLCSSVWSSIFCYFLCFICNISNSMFYLDQWCNGERVQLLLLPAPHRGGKLLHAEPRPWCTQRVGYAHSLSFYDSNG